MSLSKMLTSNLMENVTVVTPLDMIIGMLFSFALGLFIYYVYRKTFSGVMYSSGFGLSLIAMCMIGTMLIMAVSSNIVLSLGMVGALSIVRFRTAIKEPLDIVFLFWSLAAGIILATGMFPLAVFGSIAIGIVIIRFASKDTRITPYILIVNLASDEAEDKVMEVIKNSTARNILKGKTFSGSGSEELTVEVQLKEGESSFVKEIAGMAGVNNVAMVSYNGDYMN
ncbi:MAG: DUF4956 domain-containing protein [Pseudobutyrivibrio sp.]|nr:DUF4956 domain-containing protein [Pseudobutyrivibrio sp.]